MRVKTHAYFDDQAGRPMKYWEIIADNLNKAEWLEIGLSGRSLRANNLDC